jgi:N-acetylmuramoyl-L-alanine amidase/putative methionine-R-sulfoxide reductase with GAF domain
LHRELKTDKLHLSTLKMATVPTRPDRESSDAFAPAEARALTLAEASVARAPAEADPDLPEDISPEKPSQRDALQALLAFSALHEQVRRRKALAARHGSIDSKAPAPEFEEGEQFVLDEVLQLVAERAVAITGADGLAIALAENDEIVLHAAAGMVRPDIGARIDRDSAFSGASFRAAQVVVCDDTETDPRVNLQACRRLGARSMVAVPLCGRRRVIGLLEAFSTWPFAFNDSDVRNLTLLAELVVGALKPEDEDRFAESAQAATAKLQTAAAPAAAVVTTKVQPSLPIAPSPIETAEPATASEKESAVPVVPAVPAVQPLPKVAEPAAKSAVVTTSATQAPAETPARSEAATAAEPESKLAEITPEPTTPHLWKIALLVGIVLMAAFGAGLWWKWRAGQLGTTVVTAEKTSQPASTPAHSGSQPGATTSAAPVTTPSSDENEDASSEESSGAPATPDEISKFPKITGIRHWSSEDSTTVVLDLEDQVQYEAHRLTGPDRIYFDLHDTQLAPELVGKSIDIGESLLSRIRIAQPVAGMTRIVLETKANPNFSVSLEPNPYRLVIELRKVGAPPKGAINLFPDAEAERNRVAIVIPPPGKEDLQLRARVPKMRIVVDAGHGGWDLGTVGRRGLLEKDLVLEIAQRLGKLLESRLGANVIYTRQDDNYIPLDERAEIANQAQADLFISVHANYSDLPSARGVETYYTNTFSAPGSKDGGSKDADAHGNISAKNNDTLTLTPADLHERIEQSRRLAASVQRALYGTLSAQNPGLRDRGVKEAGFVVLTESAMPGILAEVSFVSSPTDEQKLRSDGYREEIAEALYHGIARYAANSRNVKMAKK